MTDPQSDYLRLELSLTNISPTEEQIERIERVRFKAKAYAWFMLDNCPDSRERSLAKTKLEESVMWAVKSIVLNEATFETFEGQEG